MLPSSMRICLGEIHYNSRMVLNQEGIDTKICIPFPFQHNVSSDNVMREALQELSGVIRVGGKAINNLQYADSVVLLASAKRNLLE